MFACLEIMPEIVTKKVIEVFIYNSRFFHPSPPKNYIVKKLIFRRIYETFLYSRLISGKVKL